MAKTSVLHIEDNKADAVLLELQLKNSPFGQFEVTWAQSLKAGLDKLFKSNYDVIILDLGLPDVVQFEGIQVLVEKHPTIPIVVHTGLADSKSAIQAIDLGAEDYLQKDAIDPNLISKTLKFAIERVKNKRRLIDQKKELTILDHAIQQSANTIVITDVNGDIEFVNKKFEQLTGYTSAEVIGKNPRVLNSGKQSDKFYKRLWERISSGEVWVGYFHNRKKDGSLFWERASISAVKDQLGNITNYIAVKEDISDLREAELTNAITSERVAALFESSQTGIIYINAQGVLQESNQAATETLGFTKKQLANYTYMDEHWQAEHIDGRPYEADEYPAAITLKTTKKVTNAIMSVFHPVRNRRIWLSIDTIPLFEKGDDELTGVYSVFRDITDAFENTRALQATASKLKISQQIGKVGYWEATQGKKGSFWSEELCKIFEIDFEETSRSFKDWLDLIHPEDSEKVQRDFCSVYDQGESGKIEYRLLLKDRSVKYIEDSWVFLEDSPFQKAQVLGVIHDITEIRRSEQNLIEASRAGNVGQWRYNLLTEELWWSENTYLLYGIDPSKQKLTAEFYWSLVHPDDLDFVRQSFQQAWEKEGPFSYDYRILVNDQVKYVQISGEITLNEEQEAVGSSGIVKDITLFKNSENQALKNEAKLNSILSSMNDLVFVLNDLGEFVDFYSSKSGPQPIIPKERIIGLKYENILPFHVSEKFASAISKVRNSNQGQEIEYYLVEKDNSKTYWNAKVSRLVGPQTGFTVVVRDITQNKLYEKKLKLSEETYKNHSENLPHILWTADEKGDATYLNEQGAVFYGMDVKQYQKAGWDILHPDSLSTAKEKWRLAIKNKAKLINTELHKTAEGDFKWLNVQANPVIDDEGELIGWVGISTDIHKEVLAREENEQLLSELGKRVNESGTMYRMTQAIVEHADSLEDLFNEVTEDLRLGFLCPNCTRVKIEYDGNIYGHKKLGYSNQISFPLVLSGKELGAIYVAVATKDEMGQPLDILKEEYLLMSSVADNLSIAIRNYLSGKELEQNELKYRNVFENLQEGYLLLDTNGDIVEYNPEASHLLASNGQSLDALNIQNLISDKTYALNKVMGKEMVKNVPLSMERLDGMHIKTNFNFRTVHQNKKPWLVEATFKDVSRSAKLNKLAELNLQLYEASHNNINDLIQLGIDMAVDLLESKAGFYHFVDEELGTIKLVQWSMGTKEVCKVPQLVSDYKIDEAGIWVECIKTRNPVIHNDYASLEEKGGLPQGHFPITRDLEIPVISNDKIVAILGVGNKEIPYDAIDVEVLQSFSNLFHSLVQRKQIEDDYLDTLKSFQQSQEAAKIGAWTVDLVYNKSWWSDTMYDIYEFPSGELPSDEKAFNAIHEDDKSMVFNKWEESLESGNYECTYRIKTAANQIKNVYAKSVVLFDEEEKPIKHVGILQDITEQVKAVKLIEEKSTQFESMVNALDGFVYRVYEDGKVAYLSPRAVEMMDVLLDEVLEEYPTQQEQYEAISKYLHEDDRERIMESTFRAIKEGTDYNEVYRLVKKNGEIIWVSDTARIINDNEGIPMMQGYIQDITESKMALEVIEEKSTQFESMVNALDGFVYRMYEDGKLAYLSSSAESVFGVKVGEVLSQSDSKERRIQDLGQYVHPEDREWVMDKTIKSIKRGEGFKYTYRMLRSNGDVVWVSDTARALKDKDGVPMIQGYVQDITESKNALEVIEEKSKQFEFMVNSLDGYVYRIYGTGRVAYLSPSFEEITGYKASDYQKEYDTPEEQLAVAIQHFHKDDAERATQNAKKSIEEHRDYSITYRIQKPDGTILWVADTAKIIEDQDGVPLIQGYVTDITDRVRAEEKVMNAVMKASDGEKARISKEIHDSLQQTLTISALNLEFVKKDEHLLSDFVKKKYATGWEYLKRSMDDTRAIAHRLMPKAIEDFGIVPVLKDMVDDLNRSSGVEFEFLTNMEGKRIQIPIETNLYKLIQESINNILKHAGANNVTIQYMGLGDIIQLIVEDDGKGFEVDKLDLGKTGFGLASMKSRATALGAEFILDSFPGHGTTLMVEIPYTKEIEYYE